MDKELSTKDISEFFFLFALFLILFEPAIFVNHSYRDIFIAMSALAWLTLIPKLVSRPGQEARALGLSIRDGIGSFYPLVFLALYLVFDLVSLAWTGNDAYIINKYKVTVPLIFLMIYTIFHFYDRRISQEERQARVLRAILALALAGLVLALIVHFYLAVYGRTYFILRTSLQYNYNRFVQSLMLGYLSGTYLISKIENNNKYLVYILFSACLLPLMYTSGSRRAMVMYLPSFILASLPFIIEGVRDFRRTRWPLILSIFSLALVLGINLLAIETYIARSEDLYLDLAQELEESGEDVESYPSAMDRAYPGIIQDFARERPLRRVESSIETGEAAGQRQAIWLIVKERLGRFSKEEWIRGAGGSEHYDVFQSDYAKEVMEDRGIAGIAHPHSFVFIDLLDGGLIKLGLTLALIASLVVLCFKFLPQGYKEFFYLGAFGLVYLVNELINSSWGVQENKITWAFIIVLMGLVIASRKERASKD